MSKQKFEAASLDTIDDGLAKALLDADTKMMQAIAAKVTCQNVKIFRGTPSA